MSKIPIITLPIGDQYATPVGALRFLARLPSVIQSDLLGLCAAAKSYGPSWKLRGGVGAFMMLARKWDRLHERISPKVDRALLSEIENRELDVALAAVERLTAKAISPGYGYDIFRAIAEDTRREGVIDDVRDLRRYLMLVEAEMVTRGNVDVEARTKDSVASDE